MVYQKRLKILCLTIFGLLSQSWQCISGNSILDSSELYSAHYLTKDQTQKIVMQKCCAPTHFLSADGHCIPLQFELPKTISLERRMRRAIENSSLNLNESINGLPDETVIVGFLQRRPVCSIGVLKHMSFNFSSEDLQVTQSMQFVTNQFMNNGTEVFLMVDPKDYCIDWKSQDAVIVEFCMQQSCLPILHNILPSSDPFTSTRYSTTTPQSPLCLLKCCPPLEVIDMEHFRCVKYDVPWQLNLFSHATSNFSPNKTHSGEDSETIGSSPLPVSWLTGTPGCNHSYEVYSDGYDRYFITSEGLLITEQGKTVATAPPGEYCFDAVLPKGSTHSQFNSSPQHADKRGDLLIFSSQTALVCFEAEEHEQLQADSGIHHGNDWKKVLHTILTGISCLFLLITCVVYTILRKDLKLPGWLQFGYALALLLTFTLLTVAQLFTQRIHDTSKNLCRALGYSLHFFFLSCFFWLTSMNLDLFLSFRSTSIVNGFGRSRGKRRFLELTAFSTAFPAAITLLVWAVDSYTPIHLDYSGLALPTSGIGKESCVMYKGKKDAQLHYFYGYVGILLFINLIVFICTLISLRNRERETRLAKRQSTSNSDYDRLQLFTRLFLIMGILWIFEAISWLFEYFGVGETTIQFVFTFTDSLNALQGVAVFIMFIWKRQTWKQLKKKVKSYFGKGRSGPICRPGYTRTMSSNSNGVTITSSVKSSHLSSIGDPNP